MTLDSNFSEQRARDALAFDPLPDSGYISVEDRCIAVTVNYSEALSALLRAIPGAKWRAELRRWEYPFAAAEDIRRSIPDINRLAAIASERAEAETDTRAKERADREAAAQLLRDQREKERQAERELDMLQHPPRPLRPEYLMPVTGAPVSHLSIEAIGDDVTQQFSRYGFHGWSGWVAQLFGSCPQKRWQRAFLKSSRDYSRANSRGSRGVTLNYLLEQGPIYEVYARTSWRSSDRYFLRIVNGKPIRMTEIEVRECLEK